MSRKQHLTRYKTEEVPGFTRDNPTPSQFRLWSRESDNPYMCTDTDGNVARGLQQTDMLYYETPTDRNSGQNQASLYYHMIWDGDQEALTLVRPNGPMQVPTGVRPRDAFLGAVLTAIKTHNLSLWFPADFDPFDGQPYSDRAAFGTAFRPRISFVNYPKDHKSKPTSTFIYRTGGKSLSLERIRTLMTS